MEVIKGLSSPSQGTQFLVNGGGPSRFDRSQSFMRPDNMAKRALTNRFLDEGKGEQVMATGHSRWLYSDWLLGTHRGQLCTLGILGVLLIVSGIVAWSRTGGNDDYDSSFTQSLWISWGLFFDPGTQTGIPANDRNSVKAVAMLWSILGFMYNLTLLGLIVDFIRATLERWRLRHGRIVQNNHTLILGLSGRTVLLLHELLKAYQGKYSDARSPCACFCCCSCCRKRCRKRKAVVILADIDELEMEQVVSSHLDEHPDLPQGNIYFRRGDPSDWRELKKVSTGSADDIIVVGRGYGTPQASDQEVLRIILALAALPGDCQVSGEVFAEMRISENVHVVNTVLTGAQGIVARVAVNRMFCLMAIDPDVGRCIEDLVSFRSGDQLFNIPCPPELVGTLFEEACYAFNHAVLVGVKEKERKIDRRMGDERLTFEEWCTKIRERNHLDEVSDDDLPSHWKNDQYLELAYHPGIVHPFGETLKLGDRLMILANTAHDAERRPRGSIGGMHAASSRSRLSLMARIHRKENDEPQAFAGPNFTLYSGDGFRSLESLSPKRSTICMIGCPADYIDLLQILNLSVAPGSSVHILSESSIEWRMECKQKDFSDLSTEAKAAGFATHDDKKKEEDDTKGKRDGEASMVREASVRPASEAPYWQMGKLRVYDHVGPTTSRRHLRQLPLQKATCVVFLSEHIEEEEESSAADSRNLNALVTLDRIFSESRINGQREEGCPNSHRQIICEMQDNRSEFVVDRNRRLQRLCHHFFHSNMLETAMFAMAAEDRAVFNSLLELLTPGRGCQIINIPIKEVIFQREQLSFWEIHAKVLERFRGIFIGYYRYEERSGSESQRIGPILNPHEKDRRLQWDPQNLEDTLLVVVRPETDEVDPVDLSNRPLPTPGKQDMMLPGAVAGGDSASPTEA